MSLTQLDHVNVRTAQLETMKQFYEEILGMHSGPRPDFPFDGAWMYINEKPVVHLVGIDSPVQPANDATGGSGSSLQLEHFAFAATGPMQDFGDHLSKLGIAYDIRNPPGTNLSQIHLHDPDGNHIHIDFENDSQH